MTQNSPKTSPQKAFQCIIYSSTFKLDVLMSHRCFIYCFQPPPASATVKERVTYMRLAEFFIGTPPPPTYFWAFTSTHNCCHLFTTPSSSFYKDVSLPHLFCRHFYTTSEADLRYWLEAPLWRTETREMVFMAALWGLPISHDNCCCF